VTTKELEELLEGRTETQSLEAKTSCPWNVDTLVKDILAMSNVEHGGRIIVGVEDKTFARIGVSAADKATYVSDTMKDQIAPYADPYVHFRADVVADLSGKEFVVISVSPFDEVPVICKKDGKDVHKGRIYYRSALGRPQSSAISTSHEMQNLILIATSRMTRRLARLGLAVVSTTPSTTALFDKELAGL
jgi:predicted HTH transcriptional regulator